MTVALQPYPAYKDSGVSWLGRVPEGWEMRRTKTLLRERVQKGFPDEPMLAATQTKGVVRKEEYENRTVLALKDLHLLKLVRRGDFVISLRSFQGGIEFAREQGIISPAYTVLYPLDASHHGYLAKLFKSKPYIENLTLHVTGIRQGQNIDYEKVSRAPIPLPPSADQDAIVRFLDHQERLIGKYIRAKQKLIALLTEQKQAIIQRAVTRGLNPDVKLKPSGVNWLGEIPEHWNVTRLKSHLSRNDSGVWGDGFSKRGTIVLRSTEQTLGGGWRITDPARLQLPRDVVQSAILEAGDLVVTKSSGSAAHIGKTSLVNQDIADHGCCFSNFMQRLRVDKGTVPAYVWRSLNSPIGREQLVFQSTTTTGLSNLNGAILANCRFAFPPFEEQIAIVAHLNDATADIEEAISRTEEEIALMREYRTRLISDVVTGKVDVSTALNTGVRGLEVGLPDGRVEGDLTDQVDLADLTDREEDDNGQEA